MTLDVHSACQPTVTVLVCTWRANIALDAQLDSIATQDWPVRIRIHDDASADDTPQRAGAHRSAPSVQVNDQNLGFVGNFERALQTATEQDHGYIALSDQDDVWHQDRVSKGMQRLLEVERQHGRQHPVLVHSDVNLIDGDGQPLADSFFEYRGYATGRHRHLPTMLGQSGVLGNTVLMNHAMAKLALPFPERLHTHDWWLGVLSELFGTRILLDTATVDYRLHASNTSNTLRSMSGRRWDSFKRGVFGGALTRDFRLPFKEDSRDQVLAQLLVGHGQLPPLNDNDERTIRQFMEYLRLDRSRLLLLLRLLREDYLKPAWLHRLRVALALLTTRRY